MVYIKVIIKKVKLMKLQTLFSVPKDGMGDIVGMNESVKQEMKVVSSYWEIECKANPSSPACLIFED